MIATVDGSGHVGLAAGNWPSNGKR